MSGITYKPVLGCNMGCTGCYEGDIFRKNGNRPVAYNLPRLVARMKDGPSGPVILHGGEIGLMPVSDLRVLCEEARRLERAIVMQTNGSLLTSSHIELIREFKIHVGVSLNGPGELNRDRRAVPHTSMEGTNADNLTDRLTARIFANIERMVAAEASVSVISVLSRTNADTDEKLARLVEWAADWGERLGIWYWRWNLLHQDQADLVMGQPAIELSPERASEAYVYLAGATFQDRRRRWDPFREFTQNLIGRDVEPCFVSPCDPYATDAVYAVLHDGSTGNCMRTAKDGIPYLRSEDGYGNRHIRQEILQTIPFEEFGCGGCRWWAWCHGGCPAEGVDGDWRNKSRFCKMYIDTYDYISDRIKGMFTDWEPKVYDVSTAKAGNA